MSFFKTLEFRNFIEAHRRVQQQHGNTKKNRRIYFNRLDKAIEVCQRDYNNIGWYENEVVGFYKWMRPFRPGPYQK